MPDYDSIVSRAADVDQILGEVQDGADPRFMRPRMMLVLNDLSYWLSTSRTEALADPLGIQVVHRVEQARAAGQKFLNQADAMSRDAASFEDSHGNTVWSKLFGRRSLSETVTGEKTDPNRIALYVALAAAALVFLFVKTR